MKSGKEIRLDQIHNEIKQLNPEIPAHLNQLIKLYSQAQIIIGHLDAESLYDAGALYAERKKKYAEVIQKTTGTVAEKEAKAELEVHELRIAEAEAKAESRKWQNLFNSYENYIIALRRDERALYEEWQKANDIND